MGKGGENRGVVPEYPGYSDCGEKSGISMGRNWCRKIKWWCVLSPGPNQISRGPGIAM